MKYVAFVIFLVLVTPKVSLAQDYLTDSVQALQHAPVYVAPGTEGTDNDTAARLQSGLRSDDNIVLIMLPVSAEASLGKDISAIAVQLSDMLGNQRIIGLAVGRKIVGYAPAMPAGVASEQMVRANNVSNDSVTALRTFTQNIHAWQIANPPPKPPLSLPSKDGTGSALPFSLTVAVSAGLAYWLWIRRKAVQASKARTHFNVPEQVRDLVNQIARERVQVNDQELNSALYQMCEDLERYFRKSSRNKEEDASFLRDRLREVIDVLSKYVDVQDNTRYYSQPTAELEAGKESIIEFGQYLLGSIQRGNDADLLDYRVNTRILGAQRYR